MPNPAAGYYFEELSIGQTAESARTVTEADVAAAQKIGEEFLSNAVIEDVVSVTIEN
jgi:hypothetical protein